MKGKIIQMITDFTKWLEVRIVGFQQKLRVDNIINELQEKDSI